MVKNNSSRNATPVVVQTGSARKNNRSKKTEQPANTTVVQTQETTTTTESQPANTTVVQTQETTTTTESQPVTTRLHVNLPEELVSQLRFTPALNELQHRIETQLNELKALRAESRRLLSTYEHDLQRVQKSKRRRRANFEPTGFIKKSLLPNNLADLLGVAHGTTLSTPEITKRFYAVLEERKLYDEKDHRIFRPDTQTRQVFGLSDDVLTSTSHKDKNGFNFMTLQKHLSQCLRQVNGSEQTQTTQPTQTTEPAQVVVTETSRHKKSHKTASSTA
jgi:chromatin remodeling complex protein RSC6